MFKENSSCCSIANSLQRAPGALGFSAWKEELVQDETQINSLPQKRYPRQRVKMQVLALTLASWGFIGPQVEAVNKIQT